MFVLFAAFSNALSNMITSIQNLVMASSNLLPASMDIFWPFMRNTPIVVPMVKANDVYQLVMPGVKKPDEIVEAS